MDYRDAYKILKRKFPKREANVCHETGNGKFVFCFLPLESELDESGIAWGVECHSVDKFTGKIEPLFFQNILGKLGDATRYEFDERDILRR